MRNKSLADKAWILFVIVLFSIIYQFSGTYAYVEGDDAASIAYHLMGRDDAMQIPYSPYHGMMDKLLSVLPAEEEILRTTAFGITRYANILMIILILTLVFDWLQAFDRNFSSSWRAFISIAVLLAAPEIFYLGLVYSPTLVAMCLVLSAHLIIRWSYPAAGTSKRTRLISHIAAMILFGFGVSFRWNVITYGLVIVTDLIMIQQISEPIKNRLFLAAGWGILALLSSFIMINLSGYSFADITGAFGIMLIVINQAGTLSIGNDASSVEILMRAGLTLSPLLSPIFTLFALAGLIKLVLNPSKLTFVVLAGFLSILPWIKSGVPKFIITFLPILIFVFVFGLIVVLDHVKQKRYKVVVYTFLIIGLAFPWLVGIRVNQGTSWGPGFELKPFTYQETSGMQFLMVFGPGLAFPTPEGVRALYGHGYVLFGKWDEFVNSRAAERQNSIDTALHLDVPLVITSWSSDYYLDNLYAMGFRTDAPQDQMAADGYFHERRFTNSQGKTILVLFTEIEKDGIPELIDHLKQYPNLQKIVLIGYPQTMRELYNNYSNILEILGPISVVADLTQLKVK